MCKRCKEKGRLNQVQKGGEARWKKRKSREEPWELSTEKLKKKKRFLFCAACIVLYLRSSIRFSWKNFEMISERVDVLTSCRPRWVEIENVNIRSVNKKETCMSSMWKKYLLETCLLSIVSGKNQELKLMHLLCSFVKEKDSIYLVHHPL